VFSSIRFCNESEYSKPTAKLIHQRNFSPIMADFYNNNIPCRYCQHKAYQDVGVLRDSLPLVEAVLTSGQIEGPASKFRLPGSPCRGHKKLLLRIRDAVLFLTPASWDQTQSLSNIFSVQILCQLTQIFSCTCSKTK
jgi:hypothetical protein